MELQLKQQGTYAFDEVSMGEILLRLAPGEGRIKTARHFAAWEGGGEYNVARGLRKCFGMKTSVITAFTNNEVGRLLEDMVSQGGVDTSPSAEFQQAVGSIPDQIPGPVDHLAGRRFQRIL